MACIQWLSIIFLAFQGFVHQSDGQPTFTSAASGDIDENTAAGTEIIQLVTTGVTGTVTYAIDSKNPNVDWFDIAVDKLKVKAGATVDYEDTALTSKIVTIVITATDSATTATTGTQSFSLTINDVNELPPSFTSSDGFSAAKATATAGTELVKAGATDPDGGAMLTYAIAGTDNHVEISSTGVVSVKSGQSLADCAKLLTITVSDTETTVTSYAAICVGQCTTSCDECSGSGSGAGLITGSFLGILVAAFIMVLYR